MREKLSRLCHWTPGMLLWIPNVILWNKSFPGKISNSKLDGSFVKLLNQIEKTHLLILDDFGLHPLDGITRLALLQMLEDRYGKKSVIITSQLPIAKWYEYIGESTIADAIMDRLAVNAHRFELKGESLRKKK